jgi:hypothetical protein
VLAPIVFVAVGAAEESGSRAHHASLSFAVAVHRAATSDDPIFMEYTSVTGPPSETSHSQHVPILSFQFAQNRTVHRGSAATERRIVDPPLVNDVCMTANQDKYTAGLFLASLSGSPQDAVLYFTKKGKQPYSEYMRIDMKDAVLTSWSWTWGGSGAGGANRTLKEAFCLNVTQLTVTFEPPGGSDQSASWDYFLNQPLTVTP